METQDKYKTKKIRPTFLSVALSKKTFKDVMMLTDVQYTKNKNEKFAIHFLRSTRLE